MYHLDWGVHGRFVRYVASIPDGVCEVAGVGLIGRGLFRFPHARSDATRDELRFSGTVRFIGHWGALDLTIADPWIETHDFGVVLTVRPALGRAERVVLASLDSVSGSDAVEQRLEVRLTGDGAGLFDDHYPPGTTLDPVLVRRGANPSLPQPVIIT